MATQLGISQPHALPAPLTPNPSLAYLTYTPPHTHTPCTWASLLVELSADKVSRTAWWSRTGPTSSATQLDARSSGTITLRQPAQQGTEYELLDTTSRRGRAELLQTTRHSGSLSHTINPCLFACDPAASAAVASAGCCQVSQL